MPPEEPDRPRQSPRWMPGWNQWPSFPAPFTSYFGTGLPGMTPSMPGARLVPERLIGLLRSRLLGRRLTVRTRRGECTLTLTDLDLPLDPAGLAMGQLDDLTAQAEDVCWEDVRLQRAVATTRNTMLRAGLSPELVAAPVDLRLTLAGDDLAALLARYRPELLLEVTPEAVVRLRWRRHPDWGHLEVQAGADGTRIWVKPQALVRGERRLSAVRRLPPFSFRLPLPPERFTIHSVEPQPEAVDVLVRVDEVRIPVPTGGMDELMRRLGKLGSLVDFSTWTF